MSPGPLMFIALLGAHLYFDYAGQGDFMAKAKDVSAPLPGVPAWTLLWSHSAIHGAAVALITGFWPLFICETVIHAWTDVAKCERRISFNTDQAVHISCKVLWATLAWWAA